MFILSKLQYQPPIDMTIQLVSIASDIYQEERFLEVLQVINSSSSDLILFPGHTLIDMEQLQELGNQVTNRKSLVILEISQRCCSENNLCILRNGKPRDLLTNQKFIESKDIDGNEFLCTSYLKELKERRIIQLKGLRILILQCGENNIINAHSDANSKAEFRFSDVPELSDTWDDLFSKIDIVLNPIHTRMNRQALMAKRREYLSSEGRAYFSVNNTDNFNQKSCHYGYADGKPIEGQRLETKSKLSCSWLYEI